MKLMRIGQPGAETPVVEVNGTTYDLRSITGDIDPNFLANNGIQRVRTAVEQQVLAQIDIAGQRIGAPIRRPGAIICIGENYAAHAAESGHTPPEHPIVFFKAPNTVVGPRDDVLLPRGSSRTDWEVELGVVIGARARYLDSPREALDHVAGFVISNDVSEREFQLELSGGQWSKGKSCETFNPLGPWMVTPDEIDCRDLQLTTTVNGEGRQDSSTRDLIFDVAYLIWHLSQYMVLEPGDLLNTGTPEGVALSGRFPYLKDGDVMALTITGLGEQRSRCVPA